MIENNIILDIRTRKEFCSGHLCGAIHIETPLPIQGKLTYYQYDSLRDKLISENLPKNKTILVYCKKGIRSTISANILEELGYNVINLGGIEILPLKNAPKCYCQ
jgi:carboxyl-terminal processing protease